MPRFKPTRPAPPLIALRYFEVAARKSNFTEAARELWVTPAAVSHQIKRLEAHLSVRLFRRLNRLVVLTEAGEKLASTLHRLFAEMHEAIAELQEPTETKVRVSALPSLASKWLVPKLHRFGQEQPTIQIRIDTSDHLVNFAYEPIDIALRYGAGKYPGLQVERLMDANAFPICSPQLMGRGRRPLKGARDLQRHTLLHDESSLLSPGVPNWATWLKAAGASDVDSRRGPMFDNIYLAIEAAIAGHGVAMGIEPLVEHDLRNGRLIRPFELTLPNEFSFWSVCPPNRANDAAVRRFREWLCREAGSQR